MLCFFLFLSDVLPYPLQSSSKRSLSRALWWLWLGLVVLAVMNGVLATVQVSLVLAEVELTLRWIEKVR